MLSCPSCKRSYAMGTAVCPADGSALIASGDLAVAKTATGLPDPSLSGVEAVGEVDLPPGTVVGEYQVTSRLGAGGMGTVYAGVHPLIGKKVAIKVLRPALADNSGVVQRFIQEARAVNQIGHPNIVDIFAFGQMPNGRHYFVMELLSGRSLRERLESGPLPYPQAFAILVEICEALDAAHAEQIVHRDLKPDNVFLADDRKGVTTTKLLDFGVAKLLNPAPGGLRMTSTGAPIGTPLYMSPEQCMAKAVDGRSDIYSLGVIMFEMFTGELPFEYAAHLQIASAHIGEAPPRPSSLAAMAAELEVLILRCLEKTPEARPQAMEVRAALQALAAAIQPGAATPSATPERRPASMRRSRAEVPKPVAPAQAPTVPPRRRWIGAALAVLAISGFVAFTLWPDPAPRTPSSPAPLVVNAPPATKREPARAPVARLQVRTNVERASWTLDGSPVGEGSGTLALEGLPPGQHTLRAEAQGFVTREEPIALVAGEALELDWTLQAAAKAKRARP